MRIKKEDTQAVLDTLNGALNADEVGFIRLIKLGSNNVLEAVTKVTLEDGFNTHVYKVIYSAPKLTDVNTFLAGVVYERNKQNG